MHDKPSRALQPQPTTHRIGSESWTLELRSLVFHVLIQRDYDSELVEGLTRLSVNFVRRRNWNGFSPEDAVEVAHDAIAATLLEIKEDGINSPKVAAEALLRALEKFKKRLLRGRLKQDFLVELPETQAGKKERELWVSDFCVQLKGLLHTELVAAFPSLSARDQAFIADKWGLHSLLDPESNIYLIPSANPESLRKALYRAKSRLLQLMKASLAASAAVAEPRDAELLDAAMQVLDDEDLLVQVLDPNWNPAA